MEDASRSSPVICRVRSPAVLARHTAVARATAVWNDTGYSVHSAPAMHLVVNPQQQLWQQKFWSEVSLLQQLTMIISPGGE
jgi:hypothetical protein